MLFSGSVAIFVVKRCAAKYLIGKAAKEFLCTGDTNAQAVSWAVDELGNGNGHVDADDVVTIVSDIIDWLF